MFATLASGYPRPDLPADAPADEVLRAVLVEQAGAGLEILSDAGVGRSDPVSVLAGRLEGFEMPPAPAAGTEGDPRPRALHEPRWDGPILLAGWQAAAAMTELPVKQAFVGPYTLARRVDPGPLTRERLTMALADALAHELRSLVAAGVPMIQVDEDDAVEIGDSRPEQQLFKAAHRRLTNGIGDAHLTLAVTGGSIATIPADVFFDAPYRSYLIDLVTAPENWGLVVRTPSERGVIAGVADARTDEPDDRGYLAWVARHAAAIGGRGPERVGLAPSGSLAGRDRAASLARISDLAEVAAATHAEIVADPALLDPERLLREGLARGYLGRVADGVRDVPESA